MRSLLIILLLPFFCSAQKFAVEYSRATVIVNNQLKMNTEASGQSTRTISSEERLLFLPENSPLQPRRNWQDDLNEKLLNVVNDFFKMMYQFDLNNMDAANNVFEMKKDSMAARKIPKAYQLYRKSLESYKSLEPLSKEVQTFLSTTERLGLVGPNSATKIAEKYLIRQNTPLGNGNTNYKQGKYIMKFSGEFKQLIKTTKSKFGVKSKFSPDQSKQIIKLKSDIAFAQSQIRKIMGNKTSLDQLTATARSEVTQIAGVVALSLKQTANIISTYLETIEGYEILTGSIDVVRTFIETSIQEGVVKDIPMNKAFKTAFEMAYTKLVIHASSSQKYPLAAFLTLPGKIKAIVDDTNVWEELLHTPVKLRLEVNRQIKQMDDAIKLNESIIRKSQEQIDYHLKNESRKFLKNPYKE